MESDDSYLKELFNGLMDSDGYWKTKSFTTVSDKLADNFCELVVKLGYTPNKQRRYSECVFDNRVIKGWSWQINISNERRTINPNYITEENYQGKIWCIKVKNKNFLVERNGKFAFSGNTDEVFGSIKEGASKEYDHHHPKNPYSATKSAQESLGESFENCYKLPIITTHTMNVIGERQHPEKLVPMCIIKIINGETITIHSNPEKTKAVSRFYIHARNVCDALLFLTERGFKGYDEFNIVGEKEADALEVAQLIAKFIGKPLKYEMTDFHGSRPGHDLRYALDGEKMKELGWEPPKTFEESLEKVVNWYIENPRWLE